MTLISFSGIDGSGKTTIAKKIVSCLNDAGIDAHYSRPKFRACKQTEHYYKRMYGDPLHFYGKQPSATFYFNMIISDWLCHVSDFLTVYKKKVLILDRYIYDIFAQGVHMGVDVKPFQWIKESLPPADIEFFLDVRPEESMKRILSRDTVIKRKNEEFEELVKLDKIYHSFLADDWKPEVVDNNNLEEVVLQLTKMVESVIPKDERDNKYTPNKPLMAIGVDTCSCCGLLQYE